jgi:type IV secretory pathway VirB10-like protein
MQVPLQVQSCRDAEERECDEPQLMSVGQGYPFAPARVLTVSVAQDQGRNQPKPLRKSCADSDEDIVFEFRGLLNVEDMRQVLEEGRLQQQVQQLQQQQQPPPLQVTSEDAVGKKKRKRKRRRKKKSKAAVNGDGGAEETKKKKKRKRTSKKLKKRKRLRPKD